MNLKHYPEYIDSEVDWIGIIPNDWKILKAGLIFKRINNPSGTGKEILLSVSEYYGVKPRKEIIDEGDHLTNADSLIGYKKCSKNDLIMNIMLAWKKGLGITQYNGIVSPAYETFNTNSHYVFPKFMHYLLRTDLYANEFEKHSYGIIKSRLRLYPDNFKNIKLLIPPKVQQVIISDFLDKKILEINKTIEKDSKLIGLLKEKIISLINHIITKGLNPNAKLKDSGAEWIGEIPDKWEIRKLKYLVSKIGSGITPKGGASVYVEEGIPLLRSQNIHFDGLRLDKVAFISEEINKTMLGSSVKNRDVLLNITGASIGRCAYVDNNFDKANVNQHVCIIRPEKIYYKFLNYYLMSDLGQSQIFSIQMGSSREGINFEQIGNFSILRPSNQEQEEIAEYLDKKISKIYKTIKKIEKKIKLMEEYKNSLIHHVVTGKVDVRGDDSLNQIHQKKDSKQTSLTI